MVITVVPAKNPDLDRAAEIGASFGCEVRPAIGPEGIELLFGDDEELRKKIMDALHAENFETIEPT
jgi:hypothetical protein